MRQCRIAHVALAAVLLAFAGGWTSWPSDPASSADVLDNTEAVSVLQPAQTITVSPSGSDYTTIKAALAAADLVATAGNRVLVKVYPGAYTEVNPLTVPAYVALVAAGEPGVTQIHCASTGAAEHGVVLSSTSRAAGFAVVGCTGAGAAGFYFPAGVSPARVANSALVNCSIGYLSESTAAGGVSVSDVNIPSGTIVSLFKVAAGGQMAVSGVVTRAAATITNAAHSTGAGSYLSVSMAVINGTLTTRGVYAENGGEVELPGSVTIKDCTTGIEVAATGGTVTGNGVTLTSSTNDIVLADTASAVCELQSSIWDGSTVSIGAAASLRGILYDTDTARPGITLLGDEVYLGDEDEQIPLTSYTTDTASTGAVSGFLASVSAGRVLDIASGVGYINTGTGVIQVSPSAQQVTVAADADFWVYIDEDGVAQTQATEPAHTAGVPVANGHTNATDVVLLSSHSVGVAHPVITLHEWIVDNIGPLWISGVAVTEHGGPSLQIAVSSGSFYHFEELHTSVGAAPITLTRWYHDNATGWTQVTAQTAVDDGYYDDGSGTLAALTGGKWKKDALYLTTTNGSTAYHLVYATAEHADQATADAAALPVPPTIFDQSAMVIAGITVLKASGDITTITDERPVISAEGSGSVAAAVDHGALAGLAADDHVQYLDLSGNAARNPVTGTIAAAGGAVILPTSATPTQTAEGSIVWDSDDDLLTVGDGVAFKTLACTTAAQTLTNKTLTTPTIASMTNATHDHADAAGGGLIIQATESLRAALEIATQAEVTTGTDDDRAITPLKLATALATHSPPSYIAETETLHTLSSATPLTVTGMTYTPAAGTYDVVFEAEVQGNGSVDGSIRFYEDAVAFGYVRQRSFSTNKYGSWSVRSRVTVTGTEAITLKAWVSASSVDFRGRSLTFTRVTAL
jgi:hypothetical protein